MAGSIKPAQPNLLRICADTAVNGELSGCVYTLCSSEPLPFRDTWDMLRRCDAYFDEIDYPQRALARRHFAGCRVAPSKAHSLTQQRTVQELMQHRGKALSFCLAVDTRRAAGWQGRLLLADGREVPFCSELELYDRLKTLGTAPECADAANVNQGKELA